MFNGIILNFGEVKQIIKYKKSLMIAVKTNLKFSPKDIGSSVCCDGVCLTITKINSKLIFFFISNETIKRSNFKNLKVGKILNLEKSLTYGQKISGHFTQGHVDIKLYLTNKNFSKFLEEKASISINGVSLTISKVHSNYFKLNIIPHTLKLTNLKKLKVNDLVNVELDIFAKYIYKYTV